MVNSTDASARHIGLICVEAPRTTETTRVLSLGATAATQLRQRKAAAASTVICYVDAGWLKRSQIAIPAPVPSARYCDSIGIENILPFAHK